MAVVSFAALVIVADEPLARPAVKEAVFQPVRASFHRVWNQPNGHLDDGAIGIIQAVVEDALRLHMVHDAIRGGVRSRWGWWIIVESGSGRGRVEVFVGLGQSYCGKLGMTENKSLDIAGIGEAAKAIPPDAWKQAVDTACTTFREVLAPITATTSGIGRLIQAKFDRLVDAEKILAAQTMKNAAEKVAKSNKKPSGKAKARVVVAAIEASASDTDAIIHQLWSNLLAQELLDGTVHPEFTTLLSKLNSHDAQLLANIAEENKDSSLSKTIKRTLVAISIGYKLMISDVASLFLTKSETSFFHEHLESLNLIRKFNGVWSLTATGWAFIEAVSDPSAE